MYPKPIAQYFAPTSLGELLALRAAHPGSTLLAGGQSLLPCMKARQVAPATLIDLNRATDLSEITPTPHGWRLGALVRHRAAAGHPGLRAQAAVLADAAHAIGDLQVRNRGTLVGSLCFGDPTGDIAPAAMALGAHVRIESAARGARLLPVSGFAAAALRDDEIATQLEILVPAARTAGAYCKFGRAAQDRAIIGVAVQLEWDPAGQVTRAAIVVGGVLPAPRIARQAAAMLEGAPLTVAAVADAAKRAAAEITPQDDAMASAAYRRRLIETLVVAALGAADARGAKP